MAAKELKALVDLGTCLGYTGEDLKQWLNEEKMRIDREKEEKKKRQEEAAFVLEKLKIEAEKESERRRQEFELRKMEMEHDMRLREVQINVEQNGGGDGGVPNSNRAHSVAMKALKIPLFNDEKERLGCIPNQV